MSDWFSRLFIFICKWRIYWCWTIHFDCLFNPPFKKSLINLLSVYYMLSAFLCVTLFLVAIQWGRHRVRIYFVKSLNSGAILPLNLILTLASCVTLDKLLHLSVPQIPIIWDSWSAYFFGLLCILIKISYVICLAHSKCLLHRNNHYLNFANIGAEILKRTAAHDHS